MRTEGGGMGRGLRGGGGPSRLERGLFEDAMVVSFGLVLTGTTGGSREAPESWGFSALGTGEAVREVSLGVSGGLLMFSKRARREDTGFCFNVRYWSHQGGEDGPLRTIDEPSGPSLLAGVPMMTVTEDVVGQRAPVGRIHNTHRRSL